MGVAAYRRGNEVISRQFQRDAYEKGYSSYSPDAVPAKPKPRPADWGGKALEKAVDRIRKQVGSAERIAHLRGETADIEGLLSYLPDYLWAEHKVPRETARKAVEVFREELSKGKKNPRKTPSTRIDTSGGKRRAVQEARYRLEDLREAGFFLSEKGWYYRRTPYESPEYLPSSIVKVLQAHVATGSTIPRRLLARLADPTRRRLKGSGK